MSKIDDLIAELCPDGVEFKALGEIAAYASDKINASELDETTFVGVDNLIANKGGRLNAGYTPNTARLTRFEIGDVLLGNIRPYLKKVWLSDRAGGCSGDVLAIRRTAEYKSLLDDGFFYYLLSSDRFFEHMVKYSKGAKMPRGDKAKNLIFSLPVPPLEVQREIVRVLDKFTQLEAELRAELEAELEARRRQYEYYRDQLLTFDEAGGGGPYCVMSVSSSVGAGSPNRTWFLMESHASITVRFTPTTEFRRIGQSVMCVKRFLVGFGMRYREMLSSQRLVKQSPMWQKP